VVVRRKSTEHVLIFGVQFGHFVCVRTSVVLYLGHTYMFILFLRNINLYLKDSFTSKVFFIRGS
jgi:hypothetical protein